RHRHPAGTGHDGAGPGPRDEPRHDPAGPPGRSAEPPGPRSSGFQTVRCRLYIRTTRISASTLGGRRLYEESSLDGVDRRISRSRAVGFLSFILLALIALALLLSAVPADAAAPPIPPPQLALTFTGVQLDDQLSYSLVTVNT